MGSRKKQGSSPKIPAEVRTVSLDAPTPKETKTAEELAQMIEADLGKHPDCPKKGFVVTVYGATHWRAMLTIKPAAGPIRNAREWWDLTDELAERLRKRYERRFSSGSIISEARRGWPTPGCPRRRPPSSWSVPPLLP
jgi:hypothetical protein